MYNNNNNTEAISARLLPGLKERIDSEVSQYYGQNRNKFINQACEFMLEVRYAVRCGNLKLEDLPKNLQTWLWFLR